MTEKRILVLEKEQILAKPLKEFFESCGPQYITLSAGTVRDALELLLGRQIDLIVSDHKGQGGLDSLQLLSALSKMNSTARVIVTTDRDSEGDRPAALAKGCTCFLVRPYPIERLADLLYTMLQPIQGFSGRLVSMKLEDVIQMFCYRRDSSLLIVSNKEASGTIYVDNGGIVHAQCDNITGVEAFYEILGWDSGEFLSQVVFDIPQRTVFMDWQGLLMESLRQKDEIRHALSPVGTVERGAEALSPGNGKVLYQALTYQDTSRPELGPAKKIMIVDDSRFIRKIVQEIVQSDASLNVVGYATNGQEALAKIDELKPDLILLDWDMPVMKGSTTLMHIMIRSPCPVIVLSGFVGGVGTNPFDLLCLGGVDFLRKPQNNWRRDGRADDLVRRIKEACAIKFERIRRVKIPATVSKASSEAVDQAPASFLSVLASFSGGCTDLIRIIPALKADLRSAVVVLHDMQQQAIGAFVDYLDRRSKIQVRPLESGVALSEGYCYIHPAGLPLEMASDSGQLYARVLSDLPRERILDHFLISASKVVGRNLIAVLLSGGPGRGIEGLRAVKQVEGTTVVQDPMSSVDPRMAEEALQEGLVDFRCLADNLAQHFQDLIR